MSGDVIEMPLNTFIGIHNPMIRIAGDARAMRKAAEMLDQYRDSAIGVYMRRAGAKLAREKIGKLMDDVTLLSAEESVKLGLADSISDAVQVTALLRFDLAKYGLPIPQAVIAARESLDRKQRRDRLEALKI
jgi:ATP-dependent protease ClpP protease subunit